MAMGMFAGTLWAASPRIAAADDAIQVSWVAHAQQGLGQPHLLIGARRAVQRIRIDVTRTADGQRLTRTLKGLRPGAEQKIELPLNAVGTTRFEGALALTLPDGSTADMPLALEGHLLAPLALSAPADRVQVAEAMAFVEANRPIRRVRVEVLSDEGVRTSAEATPESTAFPVRWAPLAGEVLRVSIEAWDRHGFRAGIELSPWRVDIPHEDVHFATGASEIPATEVGKLEGSLAALRQALQKYGRWVKVRLFVAGHTDRVGSGDHNRRLSAHRARSIARWFRAQGVRVPIAYAGFGEDSPLVATPDGVAEARNRRAEYIVAAKPPATPVPAQGWTSL